LDRILVSFPRRTFDYTLEPASRFGKIAFAGERPPGQRPAKSGEHPPTQRLAAHRLKRERTATDADEQARCSETLPRAVPPAPLPHARFLSMRAQIETAVSDLVRCHSARQCKFGAHSNFVKRLR
jgi:hypothetical protein